jgi:hypothetical protein
LWRCTKIDPASLIATRRRRLWFVFAFMLIAVIVMLAVHYSPAATMELFARAGLSMSRDAIFWSSAGIGITLGVVMIRFWRCPACAGFIGPITARHCKQCGTGLGDATTSTVVSIPTPRKWTRLQRMRDRYRRWSRAQLWPLALILAGAVAWIVTGRDRFALYGVVGGFGIYLIHRLGLVLISLEIRCPGCDTQIVLDGGHCTRCGTDLREQAHVS